MATTKSIEKQIEALARMNLPTLRSMHKTVFGKKTESSSRAALQKRIAARLVEEAKKELVRPRDERLPPAGVVLTREHEGKTHRVEVLEEGFKYGGKTYGSLSTVAGTITGTIWNGFVFFARALKEAQG